LSSISSLIHIASQSDALWLLRIATVAVAKRSRDESRFCLDEDLALFDKNVTGLAPRSTGFCELRLRQKSGGTVWVDSSAECVMEPGNPELLHLYGGLVDITERKRMEDEIQRYSAHLGELVSERTKKLTESERRFRNCPTCCYRKVCEVGSLKLKPASNPRIGHAQKAAPAELPPKDDV